MYEPILCRALEYMDAKPDVIKKEAKATLGIELD